MAKKVEEVVEEPVVEAPTVNYTDAGVKADKVHPIKLWQEGDVYLDYLHDAPKEREVCVGGLWYDHIATTDDGVWIYRNDRKN